MVDDGRTDDGRTTEHGYTIISPCEPDGSGELIKLVLKASNSHSSYQFLSKYEPPREKTNNLHMRKQRRRSASL